MKNYRPFLASNNERTKDDTQMSQPTASAAWFFASRGRADGQLTTKLGQVA